MRVRTATATFCLLVLTLASCSLGREARSANGWISPLPREPKGYELYSWRLAGERQWTYTLVSGTNRLKTVEEVTCTEDLTTEAGWVRISVRGLEELRSLLRRLPHGERVTWIDTAEPMEGTSGVRQMGLPDPEVVQEIQEYCQRFGIEVSVAARPLSHR